VCVKKRKKEKNTPERYERELLLDTPQCDLKIEKKEFRVIRLENIAFKQTALEDLKKRRSGKFSDQKKLNFKN